MSTGTSQSYEAGSSFRPAFLFLKADQRRALSALYGYARAVDDIADDGSSGPEAKKTALEEWRDRVEALFAGGAPRTPLEKELAWPLALFPCGKRTCSSCLRAWAWTRAKMNTRPLRN